MALVQVDLKAYWDELKSVVFSNKRYEPLKPVAFNFRRIPFDALRHEVITIRNFGFEVPIHTGMLYIFARGLSRYSYIPLGYHRQYDDSDWDTSLEEELQRYYTSKSPVNDRLLEVLAVASPSYGGVGIAPFEPGGHGAIALVLPSLEWAESLGFRFDKTYRFTLSPLYTKFHKSITSKGTYVIKGKVMMEVFLNDIPVPMVVWKWHIVTANHLRRLFGIANEQ